MFNNGAMLTGYEIEKQIKKGNISIDPFDKVCINPNSYNLKLHPQLLVYKNGVYKNNIIKSEDNLQKISIIDELKDLSLYTHNPIDMKSNNETIEFIIPEDGYTLYPGIIYIGRTAEKTWTDKYIPMINGRSSGGRLGVSIHICAGFGDVGFNGTWTLEITCVEPIKIYPNVPIAQICYFKPHGKIKDLYRGRYFKQENATASRFYQ